MSYQALFLPPVPMPVVDQAKMNATSAHFGFTEGKDGGHLVYRELLETELVYMQSLNVYDQNDMSNLLTAYERLPKEDLEGYATKEQFQAVLVKFAELRAAQAELLAVLHEPNAQLWADKWSSLAQSYQDYIEKAGGLQYPPKIDNYFALQIPPINKPLLSNTLIKPIQRGTRVELLMFDLIKKTPAKQPELNVFYQSAIGVNQSIQRGLTLRDMAEERKKFESRIAQYNQKPKVEILSVMIDELPSSTLTLNDWQGYFSQLSVAKLSRANIKQLKALFAEKINLLTERVNNASTQGLKGKELTTQENDIRKNKALLENVQAMASFFEAKVENEKSNAGKLRVAAAVREAQAEPQEPRVAKETYGDILVDIPNAQTQNRHEVKAQLREGLSNILKQGALAGQGYHVVETKKGMIGKTANFVLKDVNGVNLLQIVVMSDNVRIRELQTEALDSDSKVALMHLLAKTLNTTHSQATVTSEHVEKVRKLNELSVNDGQRIYVQKADGKKALYKQIENDSAGHTVGKIIPAIKIGCQGNTPEQIRDKFQAVVSDGSFVPELVYQAGIPIPILNFNIDITSETPLVAIKQYESALNAGMNPVYSSDAKRKVDSYIKKQMDLNSQDKQIAIQVAPGSQFVTGKQVLERTKKASQDGLLVTLNPPAQLALKDHIASLKPDDSTLQYDVPLKHPYAAVMVNHLLAMGIVPNVKALIAGNKVEELRQRLREDAKENAGRLVFVDSGSIARDLATMKLSFEELGKSVELSPKNIVDMLKHLKDKALPIIDLKNVSPKEQVFCAQRLAQNGIYTKFSAEVPKGQAIFIRSRNIDHAKQMFEGYLNQGFLPVGNRRIRELSERAVPIKIFSNDPKVIWDRMNHCAQSGLAILLNDEQRQIMKKFSEKNSPQLPIHGASWETVKHNIELANQLGMGIRGVTNEAQAAYIRAQALAKQKGEADMPRVNIIPIQKTESRFLRRDRLIDDREKTKKFADSLFKYGINISTAGLSVMKAGIEEEAKKTKWFGWSSTPTTKAQEAKRYLAQDFQYIESTVKGQASSFIKKSADALVQEANKLSPPRVKKVQQPPAGVAPHVAGEPSVVRVPAPMPVARPLPVPQPGAGQRVSYLPGAPSIAHNAPAGVPQLTIQSVLQQIHQLQMDLKGDLNIGSIKPADFTKITDQLNNVSSELRQAEKDLGQGKASVASNLPQYFESIKSKPEIHPRVKAFLTKLVQGPNLQQNPPRFGI